MIWLADRTVLQLLTDTVTVTITYLQLVVYLSSRYSGINSCP